jgi:large subunit ribosomal protein L18e
MKRHKNPELASLIQELKRLSIEKKVKLWKRIATDLEKPTRNRRIVNIYKINKHAKPDETVIVPGKVLGVGELHKKISIAAYNYSEEALKKIKAKGEALTIQELMQKNPSAKKVRIIG